MPKLLKSELKEIVKECLVEILSEGLLSNSTQKKIPTPRKTMTKKRTSHLDNITYGRKNKKVKKNINTNLTSNSVINEMLADTAASTLQEQINADKRSMSAAIASQGDMAAKTVNQSNPESLFGEEAASKWASLAFS